MFALPQKPETLFFRAKLTFPFKSEHKIQSGKGSLHIEMDQVPKILKPLVAEWTREGYIVSFKARLSVPVLVSASIRRLIVV